MADRPASLARPENAPAGPDRLRVLLPLPLPAALDYRAPDCAEALEPGRFVRVSLGPRRLIGVVWEGEGDDVAEERLRPIIEILPTPSLPAELRRFVDRVAGYTLTPPGLVLRMAMSIEAALLPAAPRRICTITADGSAALVEPPSKKLTPTRRRVLEALSDMPAETVAETARQAGVGAAVVRGLIAAGLAAESVSRPRPPRVEDAGLARRGSRAVAGAGARRAAPRRARRCWRISGHRARRGHRLGQDRDLFRCDRRRPRPR